MSLKPPDDIVIGDCVIDRIFLRTNDAIRILELIQAEEPRIANLIGWQVHKQIGSEPLYEPEDKDLLKMIEE